MNLSVNKKQKTQDNTPRRARPPKHVRERQRLEIFMNNNQNNQLEMNPTPTPQDFTCEGNSSRRSQICSEILQKDGKALSESAASFGPFVFHVPPLQIESNVSPSKQTIKEVKTFTPGELECKFVEVQKILRCPGCLERLRAPVVCCLNGHAICGTCKAQNRGTNNKCPSCGERINYAFTCSLIDNLVHNFIFHCKFSRSGCSFSSFSDNLNEHERVCDFQDLCCMLIKNGEFCYRSIAISEYSKHVQIHHSSYLNSGFTLGNPCELILPKKTSLERNYIYFRVFKDERRNLCFIEKINYDESSKSYFISVHFIGKRSEASKYVYTIDILKGQYVKQYTYSNECLPGISSVGVEKCDVFTLLDRIGSFSIHGCLKYNLTIQRNEVFDAIANAKIAVLKLENQADPDCTTVF